MEENIKGKGLPQEFNITSIISKNNVNYKKLENKIIVDAVKSFNYNINKTNLKFLTKKKKFFKTSTVNKKKFKNSNSFEGRWKNDEQNQFLLGISLYGKNWKEINKLIKTRTAVQVKSHAQKFVNKMKLCKDFNLGIDFTLDSINNIDDMIKQIRSINPNYDIIKIFKNLLDKSDNRFKFKESKNNKKIYSNENGIYNCLINEDKNEQINYENIYNTNRLKNNQIIVNKNNYNKNDFQLNEEINLNNIFTQNNIDLFKFNNNKKNNLINNIYYNTFHLDEYNNLQANNISFNNNINNYLLINYLSTIYYDFSFIFTLYQQCNLLFEQVENENSFSVDNCINLISILNELKKITNNYFPHNNLYCQINPTSYNNN